MNERLIEIAGEMRMLLDAPNPNGPLPVSRWATFRALRDRGKVHLDEELGILNDHSMKLGMAANVAPLSCLRWMKRPCT